MRVHFSMNVCMSPQYCEEILKGIELTGICKRWRLSLCIFEGREIINESIWVIDYSPGKCKQLSDNFSVKYVFLCFKGPATNVQQHVLKRDRGREKIQNNKIDKHSYIFYLNFCFWFAVVVGVVPSFHMHIKVHSCYILHIYIFCIYFFNENWCLKNMKWKN